MLVRTSNIQAGHAHGNLPRVPYFLACHRTLKNQLKAAILIPRKMKGRECTVERSLPQAITEVLEFPLGFSSASLSCIPSASAQLVADAKMSL